MKMYQLLFEAQQPLMFGDRVSLTGNVLESDVFGPGATLRGAVAWEILQFMDAENAWFQEAFIAGKLSIGDAYPVVHDQAEQGVLCGPTPLTALSCKRFDGLRGKGAHGVVDDVFAGVADEHIRNQCHYRKHQSSLKTCQHPIEGEVCGNRPKRFSKQLYKGSKGWRHAELARVSFTRTAIDSRVGSVRAERLYTLECLDRGNQFAATVKLADGLDPQLMACFEGHSLRVGNSRTRGLGKITVIKLREIQDAREQLLKRLQAFQKLARDAGLKTEGQTWFTVDLQTPLQALDACLNPRLSLSQSDFAACFKKGVDVTLVAQHVRHVQRGGWNALLNMPKPSMPMQAPGSVYLLTVAGSADEHVDDLLRLQRYGLGENFAEGYGHVVVCHPFHMDSQTAKGAE